MSKVLRFAGACFAIGLCSVLFALLAHLGCATNPPAVLTPRSLAGPKAFVDASDRLGPARVSSGWPALAVFDFDNDGDLDIFISSAQGVPNRLLMNDGGAGFTDVAAQAGVTLTPDNCMSCSVGDFNNDGWLDLLVGRQRLDVPPGSDVGTVLLLNNGPNGSGVVTFRQTTSAETGFASTVPAMGIGVGDLDNDGLLDIVIGRYDISVFVGVLVVPIYESQPNEIWRCTGVTGGIPQYQHVTSPVIRGVEQQGASPETAAQRFIPGTFVSHLTDVDADGRLDILHLHDIPGGIDYLHNDGGMNFSIRQIDSLNQHGGWMGIANGDFDRDGDVDYFVTNTGCDFYQVFPPGSIADTQNLPNGSYFHKLLRNDGGTLVDIAAATPVAPSAGLPPANTIAGVGLQATEFGFGATWIDADNRGALDLYWVGDLVTFIQRGLVLNAHGVGRFLEIKADATFSDQTGERALFNIQADRMLSYGEQDAGRAVAACDLDGNGFRDLIVTNATLFGGLSPINRIYLNPTIPGQHWLTIRLIGTTSNRFGIGARVVVTSQGRPQAAEVLSSTGAFTGMQPEAHFGLGGDITAAAVQVFWPSGKSTSLLNVAADQVLTLTEP